MRFRLLTILLMLSLALSGQLVDRNTAIRCGLLFVSGMADGTAETLRVNYSDFKAVFPKANDQYWNPSISWHNKWKNGDIRQGEKFPLSSTALVFTTDGYH